MLSRNAFSVEEINFFSHCYETWMDLLEKVLCLQHLLTKALLLHWRALRAPRLTFLAYIFVVITLLTIVITFVIFVCMYEYQFFSN